MVTNTTIYTRQMYVSLSNDVPDVDFHNGDEVYLIDTRQRVIYDEENNTWYPILTGGGGSTLITKTITANGIYNAADDNADGFSQVTVDVDQMAVARSMVNNTITSYIDDQVTYIRTNAFIDSLVTTIQCHNVTSIGSYAFNNCRVTHLAFPKLGTLSRCCETKYLEAFDFPGNRISGAAFNGATSLSTLVLRSPTVVIMDNITALQNTPFKSGGAGGTIYIPESLYNHLGDGTSYDYKAATNWSTYNGYGTITWAKIEGSVYETQYADGTPIPTE